PQNLPEGLAAKKWPGEGYALTLAGDVSTAFLEKGEIYDFVREHGITGFATGSISAPGGWEANQYKFPKDEPLRPLWVGQSPLDHEPQPMINMLLRHGVRSCLEYIKSGD